MALLKKDAPQGMCRKLFVWIDEHAASDVCSQRIVL